MKNFILLRNVYSLYKAWTFVALLVIALPLGNLYSIHFESGVLYGHESDGAVQGKVTDQKGLPIPNVSIALKGTNYGSVTNEEGTFSFRAPAGQYTLVASYIGYETLERYVHIKDGENTSITLTLSENALALEEIVVQESVSNKFSKKESDYIARMPLANLENPQVYSVVDKELIEEQVVTDINETVRNSPGVVPVSYPSGGFATTFRGFRVGVNARNGMESLSSRSTVGIANMERIEVLKGPSATLFGSSVSSFGGVINLVTKQPFETRRTEVSYTTGSFNLHRISADFNSPLNEDETVLFRLNTSINREKSFMNFGFNNNFLIAPSLQYKASDRLTFTLDAEMFSVNNTRTRYSFYDANSGITGPEDIKLDYTSMLYHEDADAKSSSVKIFAKAKYKLSPKWTSTTLFSVVEEDVDYSYQYYPTWLSPSVAARRMAIYGPVNTYHTNIQENINGEFRTGNVRHKVLIGANYKWYNQNGGNGFSGFIDTVDVATDFSALRKGDVIPEIRLSEWDNPDQYTLSGYATDVVQFTDRLSAMLSLRIDHFKRDEVGNSEGYEQTALAPKLGVVYQLLKDRVSIFGNYMSGFQNQAPSTQPDGALLVLDPVYAVQSEGGVKAEAFDKKLSATVSYYYITVNNAIRTDASGFTVQDGEQVSKGFELETIANPVEGLNIVAGYAYNDNRIVKATNESIEGNKAVSSPEHVANFWVSYGFQDRLKGLGIGFGGNYVSENFQFSDNVFTIPEYTVLNASVFYKQPQWRLGLKLNNLTNEKYWAIWGVPQAPTNFAANITFRF